MVDVKIDDDDDERMEEEKKKREIHHFGQVSNPLRKDYFFAVSFRAARRWESGDSSS